MRSAFSILLALLLASLACAQNARIIRQTAATAIIAGEGDSRIEAELAAMQRARELFAEYHQTRDMECSQEYRGSGGNIVYPGAGHFVTENRAYTFWQCVIFTAAGPEPGVRDDAGGERKNAGGRSSGDGG